MAKAKEIVDKAETFGERLKTVRGFLRLSREAFAERHGFPAVTVKSWEMDQVNISGTNMERLLNALAKERFPCTVQWLLKGEGPSPFGEEGGNQKAGALPGVYAERDFFLKNNPGSLVQTIPDNAMSPYFTKGDYVGGVKVDIQSATNGQEMGKGAYIIYLENNPEPLIRFLKKDAAGQLLIHANLNELGHDFIIQPDIKEAYQIIWHRKEV